MRAKAVSAMALAMGGGLFLMAVSHLKSLPQRFSTLDMTTAMPRIVQVVLAGGDRYLAANADVFRALMVTGTQVPPSKLHVQGQVHTDAAWLNPAHEDNYYVAAAMLPWGGEFVAGDIVLARALTARPYDYLPPFLRGFNHYYFRHDPLTGAGYLKLAAERADSEDNRQAFEMIAARWSEKGNRPEEAIRVLQGMRETTRSAFVKQQLQLRIVNLNQLIQLREAATKYRKQYGEPPHSLNDLVRMGILPRIPQSLPGYLFVLDKEGVPVSVSQSTMSAFKP